MRTLSQRILPTRGQELLKLAGATIRNISQGVIGISLLQAILAGLGFLVAGIPESGLLAIAVLISGILQIQGLVVFPVLVWIWASMQTTTALALTAYLLPVGLLNNVLGPIVMAHGLKTPMLVIFVGLMGGAVAHENHRPVYWSDHSGRSLGVDRSLVETEKRRSIQGDLLTGRLRNKVFPRIEPLAHPRPT